MMTSPFFFRRTVTTVVTVSAAFTLGAGCTDSTALDLSPLPLAAADIDAERAMVVACTADPAVRNVVGGFFPPEGLRATAADTFVKDLTVAFPRVRFPGSEVVLAPGVRGRHFTFAAGTWTGTPSTGCAAQWQQHRALRRCNDSRWHSRWVVGGGRQLDGRSRGGRAAGSQYGRAAPVRRSAHGVAGGRYGLGSGRPAVW